MKRLPLFLVLLVMTAGISQAQSTPDISGTWKWTVEFGGQAREQTLKLALAGDKLTGVMIGRNNQEIAIENAVLKAGEISFTITREFNGQRNTSTYTGKVAGDTITGRIESSFGGQNQSRAWEAKRDKASTTT